MLFFWPCFVGLVVVNKIWIINYNQKLSMDDTFGKGAEVFFKIES